MPREGPPSRAGPQPVRRPVISPGVGAVGDPDRTAIRTSPFAGDDLERLAATDLASGATRAEALRRATVGGAVVLLGGLSLAAHAGRRRRGARRRGCRHPELRARAERVSRRRSTPSGRRRGAGGDLAEFARVAAGHERAHGGPAGAPRPRRRRRGRASTSATRPRDPDEFLRAAVGLEDLGTTPTTARRRTSAWRPRDHVAGIVGRRPPRGLDPVDRRGDVKPLSPSTGRPAGGCDRGRRRRDRVRGGAPRSAPPTCGRSTPAAPSRRSLTARASPAAPSWAARRSRRAWPSISAPGPGLPRAWRTIRPRPSSTSPCRWSTSRPRSYLRERRVIGVLHGGRPDDRRRRARPRPRVRRPRRRRSQGALLRLPGPPRTTRPSCGTAVAFEDFGCRLSGRAHQAPGRRPRPRRRRRSTPSRHVRIRYLEGVCRVWSSSTLRPRRARRNGSWTTGFVRPRPRTTGRRAPRFTG